MAILFGISVSVFSVSSACARLASNKDCASFEKYNKIHPIQKACLNHFWVRHALIVNRM